MVVVKVVSWLWRCCDGCRGGVVVLELVCWLWRWCVIV